MSSLTKHRLFLSASVPSSRSLRNLRRGNIAAQPSSSERCKDSKNSILSRYQSHTGLLGWAISDAAPTLGTALSGNPFLPAEFCLYTGFLRLDSQKLEVCQVAGQRCRPIVTALRPQATNWVEIDVKLLDGCQPGQMGPQ